MKEEQRVFISLLKDHINHTEDTVLNERTDWDQLYVYAGEQSLTGIIYIQLKALSDKYQFITDDILERFHEGFMQNVYSYANHRLFMNELIGQFNIKNIPYIPFKGWVIKKYWPVPELRTMGDIDILIHTEDRERTDQIMKNLGYERMIDNHAVWTYYAKDIVFELHDHMFYEHLTSDIDYISYFDEAWKYDHDGLDESFHFLYLITHLAKHTVNKGMGFRSYMDLVFMCENAKLKLDWKWITEQLTELKLLRFTETCFAFCKLWFGYEPPLETNEIDPEFSRFVTEKVFNDGIFGLTNEQNKASHSAKEITHTKASYITGALDITRKRLFPSYRDMQLIPWYSFVDGRPWLLPAAWIYRWGYCIVHKQKHSKDLLTEPFRKREIIEERQKMIHDWGL